MADSRLKQQWLMFGRLTIDQINSQRTRKEQISPIGLYPYFEMPPMKTATKEDELGLIEQLKDSKWLKITTS